MDLTYLRYDVFTRRPYTGNPLAVLVDPPPLADDQHQRVANELNLSETVFLRRRPDGGWDTRIFTPAQELPFAGHPTVGAALALRDAGLIEHDVVLHEGVGPVRVVIDGDGRATLTTTGPPHPVEVADPGEVVAALGLGIPDLHPAFGPRGWSAGVPYTIVAVRDVDALGRAAVDTAVFSWAIAHGPAPALFVLAPFDGVDGARWRARMFAPEFGIVEDPATGSAAAAACGFLAAHAPASRIAHGWVIEQGVEMGRPSEITLGAVIRGNELVAATVGGHAVRVGGGVLPTPT